MPSSLNALITAWAVSLIMVLGTILGFELAYDPDADHHVPETATSQQTATSEQAANVHQDGTPLSYTENEPNDHTAPEQIPDAGTMTAQTDDHAEDQREAPREQPTRQDMATGLVSKPTPQRIEAAPITTLRSGIRVEADPELLEQSNQGPLPRVSADGKRPFNAYAAPRRIGDNRAKISIIVTDLGLRSQITRRAVSDLPSGVTFAFSPYAQNLVNWGEQARRTGHEVLLMIPMEPINYPQHDPGPFSLLTSRSARENLNLLRSSLGRLTGYVGVVNHMGSRFTAASESLKPVLEELHRRGLMILDARATQYSRAASMARDLGMPSAYSDLYIDEEPNPGEIANQLFDLESRARASGYAVGMGRPYPVTFDAVKVWAAGLERRGFVLVPISAVANQQPLPR